MIAELPFGALLPDLGLYPNPGLVEANGVYPTAGGYLPFEAAEGQSDTTTEVVRGARHFFDTAGDSVVCFGSSTRLGIRTSSGVTETSGLTAIGADAAWQFERFDDYIIAVSKQNDPQYLTDIDTDTSFSALTGSPPKAAVIGRVGNFLMLGNLNDGGTDAPTRVRWSSINDPTASWSSSFATLADFRNLPEEHGEVTAIVGGRYGLVFQERAIWRATFVGAPLVFEFQEVSTDRGCIAPNSVVSIGPVTYFLSRDGYFQTDGSSVVPVGDQRVTETFQAEMDRSVVNRVHGTVNWSKKAIVWAVITSGSDYARQHIYSLVNGEWSTASENISWLVQAQIDGETLGSLGTAFPSGLGTMSAFALGEPSWRPQDLTMAGFIASGNGSDFALFTGTPVAAEVQTGLIQMEPGYRVSVHGVSPLIDVADTNTVNTVVSVRERVGGTTRGSAAVVGANDFAPHNISGRFAQVSVQMDAGADWSLLTGAQIELTREGRN